MKTLFRRAMRQWKHHKRPFFFFCGACVLLGALVLSAALRTEQLPAGCSVNDFLPDDVLPTAAPAGSETGPDEEKVVYLTFDDGPSENTLKVLDILKQYQVPASFFVIAADNNRDDLPILARTAVEGHCIALHSCTHEYKTIYDSPEQFWHDIDQLKEAIAPYVSPSPTILRFPGGSTNTVSRKYGGSDIMKLLKTQAVQKGYTYVDWNVSADDSLGGKVSADDVYDNIVRDAAEHNTCVVLMHDTKVTDSTVEALPRVIEWFQNAGYLFDTVNHLPSNS